MKQRSWAIAFVTLVALTIAAFAHEILAGLSWYRWLHSHRPFYVAESIDKIAGTLLCLAAVWLMRGRRARVGEEIGLSSPIVPALVFALIVSSPMLIGFALTRTFTPSVDFFSGLFLTVFSPLVEEIEFRGFGVRQLQRGTGWPFWIAVWPSAILFGYGHIEKGQTWLEMAGLFLLTAAGGITLAWLVYRWQNVWVAVFLHVCMNLWWQLFAISKTAIGGWLPFVLQNLTMLLAILITLYQKPLPGAEVVSAS